MAAALQIRPVTRDTFADFEMLFGAPGAPKYCWCMAFRATPAEVKDGKGPARRRQILERVDKGVPIGLVGYRDGQPAAWVSVAPKESFRRMGGPPTAPGEMIWSLSCMYVARRQRGNGLANELIAAAITHARAEGADILEAYPVDPDAPSYRHMGFVPAFERAGFTHCGPEGRRRHVMRLTISAGGGDNP